MERPAGREGKVLCLRDAWYNRRNMTIRNRITELRHVRAGELLADKRNYRLHPKAQRQVLQSMLQNIGYADAVIARETPDGLMLIDGHLRAELDPEQVVPVLVTDLDEAEAGKLLLTLDPLAAMAEQDDAMLKDLASWAMDTDEMMAGLLNTLHPDLEKLLVVPPITDPDDVPPIPDVPVSQRGDVWLLGKHRLMCGDSTDGDDVARLLDGAKPRLMVTDPPYGVDFDPSDTTGVRIRRSANGGDAVRTNYIPTDKEAAWAQVWRLSPSTIVYCYASATRSIDTYDGLIGGGWDIRHMFIWQKPFPVMNRGPVGYQHEVCWFGVRDKEPMGFIYPMVSSVIIAEHDKITDANHAAQKPVECMERPIRNHEGDVYEPFSGSGTTLIAAERQGRTCWAMEIEPKYVDAAVARWENYTSNKAVLEERGG